MPPKDPGTSIARQTRNAVVVVLALTLITGAIFPALVIGLGQVLFPDQANGSLLRNAQGQVIGSKLIGQNLSGPEYFHPRPSAAGAGYDASASSGANFGPTNSELLMTVSQRATAYQEENGLGPDVRLPADAVTTSASGLDPDISPANARLQARRVAETRGVPEEKVRAVIDRYIDGRILGVLGERRVNVLELNLALDRELPAAEQQ